MPSPGSQAVPGWIVILLVVIVGTVGLLAAYDPRETWGGGGIDSGDASSAPSSSTSDLLQPYPGVMQPPLVDPAEARLRDDDEVIGVIVGGIARAYLVRAMSRPHQHVINDVLGKVPVSVTYCDIERCARAFTREGSGQPLDLAVGGQHGARGLLLLAGGNRFYQSTQEPYAPGSDPARFPYQPVPVTVTTWKAWRSEHPDTQVSRPGPDSPIRPAPPGVGAR